MTVAGLETTRLFGRPYLRPAFVFVECEPIRARRRSGGPILEPHRINSGTAGCDARSMSCGSTCIRSMRRCALGGASKVTASRTVTRDMSMSDTHVRVTARSGYLCSACLCMPEYGYAWTLRFTCHVCVYVLVVLIGLDWACASVCATPFRVSRVLRTES